MSLSVEGPFSKRGKLAQDIQKDKDRRRYGYVFSHPALLRTAVFVNPPAPEELEPGKLILRLFYDENNIRCKHDSTERLDITNQIQSADAPRLELEILFKCSSKCFHKPIYLNAELLKNGESKLASTRFKVPFRDRSKDKDKSQASAPETAPPTPAPPTPTPAPAPAIELVPDVRSPAIPNLEMALTDLEPNSGSVLGGYFVMAVGNFKMITPLNELLDFKLCSDGHEHAMAVEACFPNKAFLRMPPHRPATVQILAKWSNEPLADPVDFLYYQHATPVGVAATLPNSKYGKYGFTPAHVAAAKNNFTELTALESVLFSKQDNFGRVPLTYAIIYGAAKCIDFLTAHTPLDIADFYKLTPYDYFDLRHEFFSSDTKVEHVDDLSATDADSQATHDSDLLDPDEPGANTSNSGDQFYATIHLPIELTHKYVKIDGTPARIKLHYVEGSKSVCEFLNGPDKGRFMFSLSGASKRLYGANGNGWTDFLYSGAPLQTGKDRPKFNNNGAVLANFVKSPELDDDQYDFLATYRSLPAHERTGEITLPTGEHITGIARGKLSIKKKGGEGEDEKSYSPRTPQMRRTTTTSTGSPRMNPKRKVPEGEEEEEAHTMSTALQLYSAPSKGIERASLFHLDKKKQDDEEVVSVKKINPKPYNRLLDEKLLQLKLRRDQNLARKNSLLVALSSALPADIKKIEENTWQELNKEIPEIKAILENAQELTTEMRQEVSILAVSSSFKVKVILHSIDTATREYQQKTIAVANLVNPKIIQLAHRRITQDHYDHVVPINDREEGENISSSLEIMELNDDSRSSTADDDQEKDGEVPEIDVEAALPLDLDHAIVKLFERISNERRITISYKEYQNVVEQVARNNQDVFEAMHNIDIDSTIGKPIETREEELLEMINTQFNKVLGGMHSYRSVARLVANLTPGDSHRVMAAKLALGVVVAKRYLDKKAENRISAKPLNVLVAGFVQFGKTSNMMILSAILADRGFKYIIILSGKTIVLRNQTASRGYDSFARPELPQEKDDFYKAVPDTPQNNKDDDEDDQQVPHDEMYNFASKKDGVYMDDYVLEVPKEHSSQDLGKRKLRELLREQQSKITVLVCKKNKDIISNLVELIEAKCTKHDKIALIDDEADDSVNTKDENKGYTLLYQALFRLYSTCAKRAVENFVYFAYTATTAACLIQKPTEMISPDILAFMLLNQPSYLGLEHFVSPDFLDIRVTMASGAVDFLEEDSQGEKLSLVPQAYDFKLLRFIFKTFKARDAEMRKVGRYSVTNERWSSDYYRVLQSLLNLVTTKYRNKYKDEYIEEIKEEIVKHTPQGGEKQSRKKMWAPESIRVGESQYHLLNYSIKAAPQWLLEFVFRSLLTWVIYNDRLKPARSNNMYSAVRDFMHSTQTLNHKSIYTNSSRKKLVGYVTEFLADEDFDKFDLPHDLLSSAHEQQRIFQWNDNEFAKSVCMVNFIAEFFGVNVRILSKAGAVLHEGPDNHATNRRVYVTMMCARREYTCSKDFIAMPQAEREERLPQYSAFMHLSGRQLVHENMLTMIRRILAELRSPVFWDEYKENKFTHFQSWVEALLQAYKDTVNLRNSYAQKEIALGLPTHDTRASRPLIPSLEILLPMIRSLLTSVDKDERRLCDVRVRMTRSLIDPEDNTTNLTIKDLVESEENKLPRYMFIVGGDCFTRGVTLPTPLTSIYLRFMDNQEALMQALRWCGHRQPEAVDLMNVMCGSLQVKQFQRLWNNMSTNTISLIKHDLQYDGWLNKSQIQVIEEKGIRAAPRNKMWYANVIESKNARIVTLNPPIRGDPCFSVFFETNRLFNMLMQKYKPVCPGTAVAAYNTDGSGIVKSKPGILFREVELEDLLPILTAIQKDYPSDDFKDIVESLQKSTQPVSICFLHKRNYERFANKLPVYMQKMQQYSLKHKKSFPPKNLLDFVSPINAGREDKVFIPLEMQRMSVVDATSWEKLSGDNHKYSVLEEYKNYVNMNPTSKSITRSQIAPPLLCISVVDPEFRTGREEGKSRLPSLIYHEDSAKFCDFPPVLFYLYPEYQPTSVVMPRMSKKIKLLQK